MRDFARVASRSGPALPAFAIRACAQAALCSASAVPDRKEVCQFHLPIRLSNRAERTGVEAKARDQAGHT